MYDEKFGMFNGEFIGPATSTGRRGKRNSFHFVLKNKKTFIDPTVQKCVGDFIAVQLFFYAPGKRSHVPCIRDGMCDVIFKCGGSCWPENATDTIVFQQS